MRRFSKIPLKRRDLRITFTLQEYILIAYALVQTRVKAEGFNKIFQIEDKTSSSGVSALAISNQDIPDLQDKLFLILRQLRVPKSELYLLGQKSSVEYLNDREAWWDELQTRRARRRKRMGRPPGTKNQPGHRAGRPRKQDSDAATPPPASDPIPAGSKTPPESLSAHFSDF